eukprot:TRINITY_DN22139_c0_g1_i1.p1 TRINITY_DN22139_c0_g1~~TRINITY_DN22139_c0_g1_i1.p1  ORF type:complete len:879 (+),score=54.72 TRINITY_DN22139_c0_g1_i1:54-2690(+)
MVKHFFARGRATSEQPSNSPCFLLSSFEDDKPLLSDLYPPSTPPWNHLYSGAGARVSGLAPHLNLPVGVEHVVREYGDATQAAPEDTEDMDDLSMELRGTLVLTQFRLLFLPSILPWEKTLSETFLSLEKDSIGIGILSAALCRHAGIDWLVEHLRGCAVDGIVTRQAVKEALDQPVVQEHRAEEIESSIVQVEIGSIATMSAQEETPSHALSLQFQHMQTMGLCIDILDTFRKAHPSELSSGSFSQCGDTFKSSSFVAETCLTPSWSSSGKLVVYYGVRVQSKSSRWVIWRRFSEFVELHEYLRHRFDLPKLPPRCALRRGTAPPQRVLGLRRYLRQLIVVDGILESPEVCKFLGAYEQGGQSIASRRFNTQPIISDVCVCGENKSVTNLSVRTLNGEVLAFNVCTQNSAPECKALIRDVESLKIEQTSLAKRFASRCLGNGLQDGSSELLPLSLKDEYLRLGVSGIAQPLRRQRQAHQAHRSGSGIGSVSGRTWRLSLCNQDYEVSETYPSILACPTVAADQLLRDAADQRLRGRFPTLSWRHPVNGAPLCRSAQPLTGMFAQGPTPDHELLRLIRETASDTGFGKQLHVYDARSWIAANGNALRGGGVEKQNDYLGAVEVTFLGIDNVYEMHSSLDKLGTAFSSGGNHFLRLLADSQWLDHQKKILDGARSIATSLHMGRAVLVHCTDGWDRTSQLVALAQILLDPFYRTLKGFATLIEKDWCAFGHNFEKRYSKGQPIFFQWLECVWQVVRQFPAAFEFSDDYLVVISDAMHSRWFNSFASDSERERKAFASFDLWRYIQQHVPRCSLHRPHFRKSCCEVDLLAPITATHTLRVWPLHTRHNPRLRKMRTRISEEDRSLRESLRAFNEHSPRVV